MKIDPDRVVLPSSEMLAGYSDEDLRELSGYGRFIVFTKRMSL
jgi:hypothetical protein